MKYLDIQYSNQKVFHPGLKFISKFCQILQFDAPLRTLEGG